MIVNGEVYVSLTEETSVDGVDSGVKEGPTG